MLSKQVQGEILDPIILRRERDEIGETDFHHLVREILKVCPIHVEDQHRLVKVVLQMVAMDNEVPPEERPPGAPGSKPGKRAQPGISPMEKQNMTYELNLQGRIYEYLDEFPRATMEEIYQVFSNDDQEPVRLAIAALYTQGRITSETTYRTTKGASTHAPQNV